MRLAKFLTAVLIAMLASSQCAIAQTVRLTIGMPYMKARALLLSSGWTPTTYAEAGNSTWEQQQDDYLRSDFIQRGATEVGACFGTGMDQCFGIWRNKTQLFVVESLGEYKPETGPSVYFFYRVQLHGKSALGGVPSRLEWDPRSADVIPGSFSPGHPW